MRNLTSQHAPIIPTIDIPVITAPIIIMTILVACKSIKYPPFDAKIKAKN